MQDFTGTVFWVAGRILMVPRAGPARLAIKTTASLKDGKSYTLTGDLDRSTYLPTLTVRRIARVR